MNRDKNLIIYINNIPTIVPNKATIIQACNQIGLELPRFCYHDSLSISGNCRICLVEIEKLPKPQVACSFPVLNNIKVYTNTPILKKSRESILEFLLVNHPLDCPICDQGGACDLQNQSFKYGNLRGRFFRPKRGVENKKLSPVVKTVITRCIHCTRCVRFAVEVAGVKDLGTILRGSKTEIGLYTSKIFNSEVSGNIIDLCPVGALTNKVHSFKTRPWELKKVESIDTTDHLGSHITIEIKGSSVFKTVPRICIDINEEWITDKARFAYEGYQKNRVLIYYFYKNDCFQNFSSSLLAINTIYKYIKSHSNIQVIFGRNTDYYSLVFGYFICKEYGWEFLSENLNNHYEINSNFYQSTIALNNFKNIKLCLILGTNPRVESSLTNLKIFKSTKTINIKTAYIGNYCDLQYPSNNIGLSINNFIKLFLGISKISKLIFTNTLVIYGDTFTRRIDSHSILSIVIKLQKLKKEKILNLFRIPIGTGSVTNSYLAFLSIPISFDNFYRNIALPHYIIGLQNINYLNNTYLNSKTLIFENSHSRDLPIKPKFTIPLRTLYEGKGDFLNYQGKIQQYIGINSNLTCFESFQSVKIQDHIFLINIYNSSKITKSFFSSKNSYIIGFIGFFNSKICITPLKNLVDDYYRTDIITIFSTTLTKLVLNIIRTYWSFKN